MGWWEYWLCPRYFTSQGFEIRTLLNFLTFCIIQWKLFQRQQWNRWWWVHYTFTSVLFSSQICTLCNEISWQVNLSRLDFPWILRWCYFHSLSASFWLFSFVCSFISDILQCQILSLLLQNCKVKQSRIVSSFFVLLSFSSESFQRQTQPNSVPLLPKNQEKKREEILIGCFWREG